MKRQNIASFNVGLLLCLLGVCASPEVQAKGHAPSTAKPTRTTRPAATTHSTALRQTAGHDIADAGTTVTLVTHQAQNDARLARLEYLMIQLVNAERTNAHLHSLVFDNKLASVARAHSTEMRDRNYFAHQSPTARLRDPLDRYRALFGTTPFIVAENIYRSWGTPHTLNENYIKAAHKALMNSPGHRANILRAGVTRLGIGIVSNQNGDVWITQMFSQP